MKCRLHEDLKRTDAHVRFKARHLDDIRLLRVDANSTEVPEEELSLIPHDGKGFLHAQFPLQDGMLRDGDNEIGFAFREGVPFPNTDVIIQEVEIRVTPS